MKPSEIAWSHSALAVYEACPQRYYREKVTKEVPFERSEALIKGDDVHKSMELYVGSDVALPRRWAQFQEAADWARDLPNVKVEDEIAFTADLQRCGWFDRKVKVWARCKVDVTATFSPELKLVVDWKTGNYWGEDGQAAMTALFLFWDNPELQEVRTVWYYLEKDKKVPNKFTRDQMPDLEERPKSVLREISNSYRTGEWPENPNKGCRFCGVKTCRFRGKSFR